MKSPYFTEEHLTFRQTVRRFIENEVTPNADKWEKEERIPKEIWRKMADNGFLGINYSQEYGGAEADFFYSVVFLEELSRGNMGGFAAAVGVHQYMAMAYIDKFASGALKAKYLGPGIVGKKIGALAITEPNTGSDVSALRTRALRDGDHYIINGAKTFITNGYYGDFIVLAAKTDPGAGQSGISLFVVDRDSPGVISQKLKKIGWHCSDTAELSFDDVKIPASHIIGMENLGFYYIMDCFQLERLVAAITAVAGADYCLETTLRYIEKREVFNRPLSKFQVIRHSLADLATELEAARQLTYHTCWLHSQGAPAIQHCSMAKLYTSELAKKITDACLQYFGGYGYMDEYLISRMYRDARVGTIVGGASEIMREIIAKLIVDNVEYHTLDNEVKDVLSDEGRPKDSSAPSTVGAANDKKAEKAESEAAREVRSASESKRDDGGEPVDKAGRKSAAKLPENFIEYRLEELFDDEEDEADGADLIEKPSESEEGPAAVRTNTGASMSDKKDLSEAEDVFEKNESAIVVERSEVPVNAFGGESGKTPSTVEEVMFSLPQRFRAEKAQNYRARVHFKITGAGGGEYTVRIESGKCKVDSGLVGEADCLLETSAKTYLNLELGKTNHHVAFMMGKVKISDVPKMMVFIKMFNKIPEP